MNCSEFTHCKVSPGRSRDPSEALRIARKICGGRSESLGKSPCGARSRSENPLAALGVAREIPGRRSESLGKSWGGARNRSGNPGGGARNRSENYSRVLGNLNFACTVDQHRSEDSRGRSESLGESMGAARNRSEDPWAALGIAGGVRNAAPEGQERPGCGPDGQRLTT